MFGLGPGFGRLPRGGMHNLGRGRGRRQPYAVVLGMRLLYQISQLQRKPPLTLALMAGMAALHLMPDLFEGLLGGAGIFEWSWLTGGHDHVRRVCLLPAAIFESYERTGYLDFRRLLVSPFVHGDDMHLYYNMASFLLKGVSLELAMGTSVFAGMLAFTLLASQALMLLSAWVLSEVFDLPSPMHTCTVGFSGVLFALTYVLSRRSLGVATVMGFRVNIRYVVWLELVLASVMVANASFLGHLCGILAGMLYVEVPVVLHVLNLLTGTSLLRSSPRPSYTYSSGTSSAPPGARNAPGDSRGQSTMPPQSQQPAPPSHYDMASDADTEEAAIQEALRRSLLDSKGDGRGHGNSRRADNEERPPSAGNVGMSTSWQREPAEDPTASAAFLGSPAPLPTAPLHEDLMDEVSSGGLGRDELRRRRLQRLGGGS